ncbi:MAG: DUF1638 domain-containing protein [Phycisphaerae bacterium]|nr:DUF1638 domain-containing protein [Phycisphaerae bacterium]
MKKYKFIGCEIFYREACFLAATCPAVVDIEFLHKGLHDLETADMTSRIQAAVDAVELADGYDAILLGYARCNDGLVGVTAGPLPLVIPKAHDCITLFFGSRGGYREYFDANPGTYFHTTGWVERNDSGEGQLEKPAYGQQGVMAKLGLTESYEEMVAKHGKDNADYILETLGGWEQAYSKLCYLEMGTCDESAIIEASRQKAADKNWQFELRQGKLTLLKKLFAGDWDDDFVIIPPGGKIIARNDAEVLDVEMPGEK